MSDRDPFDEPEEGGPPPLPTTCGLATASLVLGVLGITCFSIFAGIPALITGIRAQGKIRRSRGALTGGGLATGGIALGAISCILLPVAAGFLVPTLMRGRGEAYKIQCASNLLHLFPRAISYSSRKGEGYFPHSPAGSIASLQTMLDADPEGMSPRMFLCPDGDELPAQQAADGRFRLSEETCSYEMTPRKIRNTDAHRILLFDKAPRHRGGRNVLFSDGSMRWVAEPEFQRLLAEARGP